jgi:hypothetical protein
MSCKGGGGSTFLPRMRRLNLLLIPNQYHLRYQAQFEHLGLVRWVVRLVSYCQIQK